MTNKYGDKYRVHDWVKFSYSEIGEYIDEYHTDRPLRNDEIINLLNEKDNKIKELQQLIENMSDYIEKLGGWED